MALDITIRIDDNSSDDKQYDVTFSNSNLDNYNFLEMELEGKTYCFLIDDLCSMVKAFDDQRERFK
jgi:hypothetical protein